MPNYNLLFIEKNIAYYKAYEEENFEHVKNEAAAVDKMKELDTDVIVFNNDNEIDKDTEETLGERLCKTFVNKKNYPYLSPIQAVTSFKEETDGWKVLLM